MRVNNRERVVCKLMTQRDKQKVRVGQAGRMGGCGNEGST